MDGERLSTRRLVVRPPGSIDGLSHLPAVPGTILRPRLAGAFAFVDKAPGNYLYLRNEIGDASIPKAKIIHCRD